MRPFTWVEACAHIRVMNQDVFFIVLIALMADGFIASLRCYMFQNYDRHTQAHEVEVTAGISPQIPPPIPPLPAPPPRDYSTMGWNFCRVYWTRH